MKLLKNGFTLIEMLIVVAIVAVISSVAIPMYKEYAIRSQFTEMFTLIQGAKTNISTNVKLNESCTGNDPTDTMTGKYGVLKVQGEIDWRTFHKTNDENYTPSEAGCLLRYTFNDSSDPKLKGKYVEAFIDTDNAVYLYDTSFDLEDLYKWKPKEFDYHTIPNDDGSASL